MYTNTQEFDPTTFSFANDPVLIVEDFWSAEEAAYFRECMTKARWINEAERFNALDTFYGSGTWQKGFPELDEEKQRFFSCLMIPCAKNAMTSTPGYDGHYMNMNYYSYGQGDCLPTHNDYNAYPSAGNDLEGYDRRLAYVCYWHETWKSDWGGELFIYQNVDDRMLVDYCIIPKPGTLVMFTVPRPHRIARIDPYAGDHKRLSSAGWLYVKSTQPEELHREQEQWK